MTALSAPQDDLFQELSRQRVAVVGNARSLEGGSNGAAIDGCDLVIRMHRAPMPQAKSHGSRTDWLALGMPVPQDLVRARGVGRILWMARKRRRLRGWMVRSPGFYRHPPGTWSALAAELGAPPSTGAMVTDLVARSPAAEIHLFGFDFFASLSASGRRTADQVPHDFAAEQERVARLMAADGRLVLHPPGG
ncbi:MAG: glycosyltransferase family 29 protein [Pseudomonadota bacterium]